MGRTTTNLTASPVTARPVAACAPGANIAIPCVAHPFEPRPTQFIGVREITGWGLRAYTITLPGDVLDHLAFEAGLALAANGLPQPPHAAGRFGVGFVILHQGRGMDYLVLAWWSRENELPMRIFVRERGPAEPWRPAVGEESICVWDIEVIKRERDLFVGTILAASGEPDIQGYLSAP